MLIDLAVAAKGLSRLSCFEFGIDLLYLFRTSRLRSVVYEIVLHSLSQGTSSSVPHGNLVQISVPKLHRNDNLVVDSLPLGIINDLRESMNQMVLHGFEKASLRVYTAFRGEFLKETLSVWTFGLQFQELNMEDIGETENIESWIKALNLAARILFPNERKLCNLLFEDEE
ncbi:hypothetical protein VNO78_31307 [Psophocarpus tetragonolobus]|uniref:Uncharacterized protein n=1 Tax=Psophocarpus tetragonolobus TaxID=3891 RepID=A0AAN9RYE7_PSOTE